MSAALRIDIARSALEIEQVRDLRRSVLCGELHWPRDVVSDPSDDQAILLLGSLGPKPVASLRLLEREGLWHLELLAVLSHLRRQGLGRQLLEAAEAHVRRTGAAQLRVILTPELAPFFEHLQYTSLPPRDGLLALEKRLG